MKGDDYLSDKLTHGVQEACLFSSAASCSPCRSACTPPSTCGSSPSDPLSLGSTHALELELVSGKEHIPSVQHFTGPWSTSVHYTGPTWLTKVRTKNPLVS